MSCTFRDKKKLPYRAQTLYEAVADIESYPAFLPGCLAAQILERGEGFVRASLTVGYGPFRESYVSKVLLKPFHRLDVIYEKGPFLNLQNYWTFHPLSRNETEVEFFIEFKLRSFLLQKAMEAVFLEKAQHLMEAFEKRVLFLEKS